MGGRSKIQYDFGACERELVNEVLYSCTKIDMKDGGDLNFMFADDVRHSQLFSRLHKKIPQVSILFHSIGIRDINFTSFLFFGNCKCCL